MSKITVKKNDEEFDIEVGPDNTAYLSYGETVVSNPSGAKIHLPRDRSHIKSLLALFIAVSVSAFIAYAIIASNN